MIASRLSRHAGVDGCVALACILDAAHHGWQPARSRAVDAAAAGAL
ncbi:hypothetical protein GV829_06400 [Sphingomonas lacunae]|uniref:Uncharacterized protein n=1 Tax=Sphingomonas lacunae TaxID=2698828 RepID=A0A6M4ASR0_9SPHN|nr:hypothetical protein [Sphingomonas lacunae]QJQ32128.1 hypothetical protein GV829_06400 [Sphingomonas lacunae]